ncbi:sigma-70 family RNA polymerase sigma factor [Globicatella sulfidifaciens]|uniref:Sigma-70 family RNA polymerase sigma factor n=1 Tax=Globicatella sulfidifaciens TaxID=136093 RepID=A0A7X8C3Q0_9LACT|nr:sigma-70 family RNA polymerase sigma factor [Globicatella sulfidifaciens]NLJ18426.1 sigma-70 family RNA polymerase sigma factor [Globicatella sulfidifaciens]
MELKDKVNLFKKGETETFEDIYLATNRLVFFVVSKLIKDQSIVEDIVQDTYITAFEKIDTLTHDNIQGWLNVIARNKAKDYLKKKKPMHFTDYLNEEVDVEFQIEDESLDFKPDHQFIEKERSELMDDVLHTLPDDQRLSVMMFYFEELTTKEIAEELSLSENTIKSRLRYAREAIKEKVEILETQGYKLLGATPFSYFVWSLQQQAQQYTVDPSVIKHVGTSIAQSVHITPTQIPNPTSTTQVAGGKLAGAKAAGTASKVGLGTLLKANVAKVVIGTIAVTGVGGVAVTQTDIVDIIKPKVIHVEAYLEHEVTGVEGQGSLDLSISMEHLLQDVYGLNKEEAIKKYGNIDDLITYRFDNNGNLSNGDYVEVYFNKSDNLKGKLNKDSMIIPINDLFVGTMITKEQIQNEFHPLFNGVNGYHTTTYYSEYQLPYEVYEVLDYQFLGDGIFSNGDKAFLKFSNTQKLHALGYALESDEVEFEVFGLIELENGGVPYFVPSTKKKGEFEKRTYKGNDQVYQDGIEYTLVQVLAEMFSAELWRGVDLHHPDYEKFSVYIDEYLAYNLFYSGNYVKLYPDVKNVPVEALESYWGEHNYLGPVDVTLPNEFYNQLAEAIGKTIKHNFPRAKEIDVGFGGYKSINVILDN